ncbi:hypothetical protein D3C72_2153620 [compost metagenome]
MPDELLLTTPPILQVAWLAGSGPILRLNGFKARLALATMMAGPSVIWSAPGWISSLRQPSPSTARTPSVTAWPDNDVPAARKVIGRPSARAAAITARTSSSELMKTTTAGISR